MATPGIFEEHPLVKKLVPDPKVLPDVVVMSGFIGHSLREGFIRLYLSPRLDSYREIAVADIVHHQDLDHESEPLGGSVIWVKADAQVSRVASDVEKAAAFLAGEIAAKNMGRDRALPPIGCSRGPWRTSPEYCNPNQYTQTCPGGYPVG